ncbi:GntR family transcriptional regulator [Lacisediminimonas sp.]|uniref:GntR family transcriptional regulator n=1 Tax=Lacisediminimonas sp. TaxID=3060582 RepID=UPI002726D328|nr:GntR family transcriptional regulator [Lacisediminimonas sp.]MDO8301529.1 GntR family transcriptional regulator [Lacisediminimonas sp.]MDO9216280.1 GntR family transcriptional regulator [Lacisediminimonas sp.]
MARTTKSAIEAKGNREAALQGLQRDSPLPLYEQIADRMRASLHASGAGSQFPTEESQMASFAVSRSTIRKAVQRLVDEGILVRRQGKGTFVARPMPQIVHSIDRMAPFAETFSQVGEDIRTEITDFAWNQDPDLPDALNEWERPVLSYLRLYVSRGVPHAITRMTVPLPLGRKISRADVESSPMYDILQKKLKVKLARAEFLVSCRQPSAAISSALNVSQSSFLLVLDRITRDEKGRPVEMTTHFLRPDVYQLSVVLSNLERAKP